MTKVSDEAGQFLDNLLTNQTINPQLKTRLVNRIVQTNAREQDLRAQVAIFVDSGATIVARLAALDRIVDYWKGDL
jgi:hypothetical protein